jgi:hypothetical protein
VPNLEYELRQLEMADEHIRTARERIATMRASILHEQRLGEDTALGQAALGAVLDGLQAFLEHRQLIQQTILDIRSGKLPSA